MQVKQLNIILRSIWREAGCFFLFTITIVFYSHEVLRLHFVKAMLKIEGMEKRNLHQDRNFVNRMDAKKAIPYY